MSHARRRLAGCSTMLRTSRHTLENLLLACLASTLERGASESSCEAAPELRAARRALPARSPDRRRCQSRECSPGGGNLDAHTTRRFQAGERRRTVTWMRAERLERARRELLSARLGDVRVTDVATRWDSSTSDVSALPTGSGSARHRPRRYNAYADCSPGPGNRRLIDTATNGRSNGGAADGVEDSEATLQFLARSARSAG
jgi:hypothetical protein